MDWLADRIVSLAPHSAALARLESQSRGYFVSHTQVDLLTWRSDVGNEPPLTVDEVDEACDALAKVSREMVDHLKRLAQGRVPRNSLLRRVRSWRGNRKCLRAKRNGS